MQPHPAGGPCAMSRASMPSDPRVPFKTAAAAVIPCLVMPQCPYARLVCLGVAPIRIYGRSEVVGGLRVVALPLIDRSQRSGTRAELSLFFVVLEPSSEGLFRVWASRRIPDQPIS